MKEFFKQNFTVTLAFVLALVFTIIFLLTKDPIIATLISTTTTGFFALARPESKPAQTINAETIETANATTNDDDGREK
jgi:hypothetical protein